MYLYFTFPSLFFCIPSPPFTRVVFFFHLKMNVGKGLNELINQYSEQYVYSGFSGLLEQRMLGMHDLLSALINMTWAISFSTDSHQCFHSMRLKARFRGRGRCNVLQLSRKSSTGGMSLQSSTKHNDDKLFTVLNAATANPSAAVT